MSGVKWRIGSSLERCVGASVRSDVSAEMARRKSKTGFSPAEESTRQCGDRLLQRRSLRLVARLAEARGLDGDVGLDPDPGKTRAHFGGVLVLALAGKAFRETVKGPPVFREALQIVAINLFGFLVACSFIKVAPSEWRTGRIHGEGSS